MRLLQPSSLRALMAMCALIAYGGGEAQGFSHRVDIRVPKGADGMQPELALVYDPSSGNGIVGVGWQLVGLSAISRVNYGKGIKYLADDTFEHSELGVLVAQPDGAYRSRKESFARFEKVGNWCRQTGPCGWMVQERSGKRYYYGQNWDSRLETPMQGDVRTWALSRVEDLFGNGYEVTYLNDIANGQLYPMEIAYTSGPGLAARRSVKFVYEDRSDTEPGYPQNVFQRTTRRLKWISVFSDGKELRKYRCDYVYGGSTGRSRLVAVQEYGSNGGRLPAQTFGWQEGGTAMATEKLTVTGAPDSSRTVAGDFNGDGRTDLATVWTEEKSGQSALRVSVALVTDLGFDAGEEWLQESYEPDEEGRADQIRVGDFNGDGKSDLALVQRRTGREANAPGSRERASVTVLLSGGRGFSWMARTGVLADIDPARVWVGDFDGDGRMDLAAAAAEPPLTIHVVRWTIGRFDAVAYREEAPGWEIQHSWAGDFDGDGRTDLAFRGAGSATDMMVYRSKGEGFEVMHLEVPNLGRAAPPLVGDFNGDGRSDFALYGQGGKLFVYLSTGYGFERKEHYLPNFGGRIEVGDFNGDGKTDVATWREDGNELLLNLSNGAGFWQVAVGVKPEFTKSRQLVSGDFKGQGRRDLAAICDDGSASDTTIWVNLPAAPAPDLMTSIDNGLDGRVEVEYLPAPQVMGAVVLGSQAPGIPNTFPRILTTKVTTKDGRGGTYVVWYTYTDGRILPGTKPEWRDLGFRETAAFDEGSKILTRTFYSQTVPFERRVLQVERRAPERVIERTEHRYLSCPTEGPRCRTSQRGAGTELVLEYQTVVEGYELGGVIRTSTERYFDEYGHVIELGLDATDQTGAALPRLTVITNYLPPRGGLWFLDRVQEVRKSSNGVLLNLERDRWDGARLVTKSEWLDTAKSWVDSILAYDVNGLLTSLTLSATGGGLVRRTSFEYADGYRAAPTKVVNGLGQAVVTVYGEHGLPVTIKDANGATTTITYDEFGRKQSETRPDGGSTAYQYLQSGSDGGQCHKTVVQVDANRQLVREEYFDGTGFVFRVKSWGTCSGNCGGHGDPPVTVDYRKDDAGRLAFESRPYYPNEQAGWTWVRYDSSGRPSAITTPDGMVTRYAYGNGENVVSVTDANGKTRRTYYDARRRPIRLVDPAGQISRYRYDVLGRLLSVNASGELPNGGVTRITYDSLNRRSTFTAERIGNRTVYFKYDALDRLIEQQTDGGQAVVYQYDDASVTRPGRLIAVTDTSGTTRLAYTAMGQLARITREYPEFTWTQAHAYDQAGRLIELTYPNGSKASYQYSTSGNLWKVRLDGVDLAKWWDYDARGKPRAVLYGNGVVSAYQYDAMNHLTSLRSWRDPDQDRNEPPPPGPPARAEILQDLAYDWYGQPNTGGINLGRVTDCREKRVGPSGVNTDETQIYAYDDLYRVTRTEGSWGSKTPGKLEVKSYAYDAAGNPLGYGDMVQRALAFSGNQVVSGTGLSDMAYDAAGNMLRKRMDEVSWEYTWTAENFLARATRDGELSAQLVHDTWGRRTKMIYTPRQGPTVTTHYFGDTYEWRSYSDETPSRYTVQVFAAGQLLAQVTKTRSGIAAFDGARRRQGAFAVQDGAFEGFHSSAGRFTWVVYAICAAWVLAAYLALPRCGGRRWTLLRSSSTGLRLACSSVILFFTLSSCGGGCGGERIYDPVGYRIERDTTWGPALGTYFFHRSRIGSSSVITDAKGREVTRLIYLPFGEMSRDDSDRNDEVVAKFSGQRLDEETGLYYYDSRFYDPALGRFVSADVIVPGVFDVRSRDPYGSVPNDPVRYVEPMGQDRVALAPLSKGYETTGRGRYSIEEELLEIRVAAGIGRRLSMGGRSDLYLEDFTDGGAKFLQLGRIVR